MRRLNVVLLVGTLLAAILVTDVAYASDGKLVRREDGYNSADTALAGFFGYSPAEAVSAVTKTKYDGFPNYEIACSYIALADDGWWYYSGDANTLYNAKAELFGEYGPTSGGGGGHAFDPPDEPDEPQEPQAVDGYTILRGGTYEGNVYTLAPKDATDTGQAIKVDITQKSNVLQKRDAGWNVAVLCKRAGDTSFKAMYVLALPPEAYIVQTSSGVQMYNPTDERLTYEFAKWGYSYDVYNLPDDGVFKAPWGGTSGSNYLYSKYLTTVESDMKQADQIFFLGNDTSQPQPTDPDPSGGGDDEPSAPEPPEIDPTEYTTYTTNNTDIDVNVTIDNDGGQTDLTPITLRLDRIYARLGDIGSDLLNLDLHMQTAFYDLGNRLDGLFSAYFGSVGTWLQMIYNRLEDINRNIQLLDKSTDDLTDLSGVQSYLMQILATLQGMGNNAPAADPTDMTGVMRELGTIEDLLRYMKRPFTPVVPPVVVGDDDDPIEKQVTDKGSELARHFPFSIPWDVYGMLALFVADPVAPQFDIPVFGMEDEVHVDLSGWDTVAAVSRSATFVLFALGLALRTKDMIWKD